MTLEGFIIDIVDNSGVYICTPDDSQFIYTLDELEQIVTTARIKINGI